MAGALSDLVVVDLTRILAGPWATQVLADYGATVWKVEQPSSGDDTRHWGPPFVESEQGDQQSAYFLSANRGKRSISLDFSNAQDRAKLIELIKQADILVENFKVDNLKKYKLDYQSLKVINPRLIYCSITGFGQQGSNAHRAGYDAMIQAMGGLMSITGEPVGEPQKVGVAVTDMMTGMYAVSAILAALYHRAKSDEGQHIDLALFDTQVAMLANQGSNYLVSGEAPKRMGNAHPNIVPYQAMPVADGYIFLAVGNDQQFTKCCQLLGCTELAEFESYKTNSQRVNNREQLIVMLSDKLKQQSAQHWLALFSQAKIPCGPINDIAQVFAEPQVKERAMQFSLEQKQVGPVPQVANPVNFSLTPNNYQQAPPSLGEHNQEFETWLANNN